MSPSSGELWLHPLMPTYIDVDCLLPTGILIVRKCKRESSLEQVKRDLWQEARFYPLFHELGVSSRYIFKSVTSDAEVEEFYDETRRLCDLRLFHPILKIVEPEGNREENLINSDIGVAMNMSVNELNDLKDLEVITFRRTILDVCKMAVDWRSNVDHPMRLALYKYPPNIESGKEEPPEHISKILQNSYLNQILVCVWVVPLENVHKGKHKYTVKMRPEHTPEDVVMEVVRKKLVVTGIPDHQIKEECDKYKTTYILRVCGLDEYLLKQCPLTQYKYVRKCIIEGNQPQFMLVTQKLFLSQHATENAFIMPSYHRRGVSALEDRRSMGTLNLWSMNFNMAVKIHLATYITVKEPGKLFVKAGIYHGLDLLCPTKETSFSDSERPRWDQELTFDISIVDLPRAAKLCMGLCFVSKRKQKTKQPIITCLCWVNINLFDFLDRLQSDKKKIYMTQATSDEPLNPLANQASSVGDPGVPCIDVEFNRYSHPVQYPTRENINHFCHSFLSDMQNLPHPSPAEITQIQEIISRDSLAELADQERMLLWEYRYLCLSLPTSLPKLLSSTDWSSRKAVSHLYSLLSQWPLLDPEDALELLDCTYPDPIVREFAVSCLESKLNDNQLSLYLLQLVQVLKFEPYIDNPLTRFLLKRALLNRNIGHFFFWHLKSEIHTQDRQRYGLILEAYCRGCGMYLKSLIKQVDALDKLTKLTEQLRMEKEEDHRKFLERQMGEVDYLDTLQNLSSPLDCSQLLGPLKWNKSKVMNSKKRPLKLTWENASPQADMFGLTEFKIIFKNGDDLRQDMLTLQVIRIMDSIWQSEGMDLKMSPYGVLSTGNSIGVISVVQRAETVMHIMKGKMTAAMQITTTQLHKWLKDQNDPKQYDRVIDNFTRSCAGYSVATYILGIGDRHPDNIMVTTDGKLFHIDFGHFLDHKKKKFGLNRERVPFILTDDLITTIARGNSNGKASKEFDKFQELCGKAYMCLRKHASLLCTLFSMMLNSGIPELQTQNDIGYLRKTLAADVSEEVAIRIFQSKFDEAYHGAWTQKLDWFFHYLNCKKS